MADPTPEIDLKEAFKKESGDPAMIAYMKSLGIDPNYVGPANDPRRVVINEIAVIFEERPDKPQVLKLETPEDIKNAHKHPLVIKEGCEYKIRVSIRVQHNVVLGFSVTNTVSTSGLIKKTLQKDTEMLGTYPPKNEFQYINIPDKGWAEAPKGIIGRGDYHAVMCFTDDDQKTKKSKENHLEFEYTIRIAKDFA